MRAANVQGRKRNGAAGSTGSGRHLSTARTARQQVTRGVSVNTPASDTQLNRMTATELDTVLGNGNYRLARKESEVKQRGAGAIWSRIVSTADGLCGRAFPGRAGHVQSLFTSCDSHRRKQAPQWCVFGEDLSMTQWSAERSSVGWQSCRWPC